MSAQRSRAVSSAIARSIGSLLLLPIAVACGESATVAEARADLGAQPQAELFAPGIVSDQRWQYRITFTPDGDTAYFSVADGFFPQSRRATIYVTHRRGGAWQQPEVAPFSGQHVDIDPFVTPDGGRLFFSSIRLVDGAPRDALDLYVMGREPGGWSEPMRLGPEVNSDLDELYASVDAAGTLYFASGPPAPTPEVNWNIYHAEPAGSGFTARTPLDGVNLRLPWDAERPTRDWSFNPEISRDGRVLLFASLRDGGYGFGDLYVSHRTPQGWSEPRNLGSAVNTENDEFHPTLSPDGRWLYFARTVFQPELVPSNFYRIPVSAVETLAEAADERLESPGAPGPESREAPVER
jgi:Tol biopolymer transport system component